WFSLVASWGWPIFLVPGLRDDYYGAAGVAGQPAGDRAADPVPDVLRRSDHERVRAELLGGRGEFPGRAAPPGADVHLHVDGSGDWSESGQHPPPQPLGVPGDAHDLAGQRLAVDARRAHVYDQQRPAEPLGHACRIRQRVAAGGRTVIARDHRMLEAER